MEFPKSVLAAVSALFALCAAVVGSGGHFTLETLIGGVAPAVVLAFVGKLVDPQVEIGVPPVVLGLATALGAAVPVYNTAIADGVVTGTEWAGIASVILGQLYHTSSTPKRFGFRR